MSMAKAIHAVQDSIYRQWARIVSAALSTAAITFVLLGLFLLYLQNAEYDPPLILVDPQSHFATQLSPSTFVERRDFTITRQVEFSLSRELIQYKDGVITRAELWSPRSAFYTKGDYQAQRIIEMPRLPAGEYELKDRICWQANVLRRDCLDLPVLILEIHPEVK